MFCLPISGGYSLEPVASFRWTILAIASFRFYHYFVLQPVSLVCITKSTSEHFFKTLLVIFLFSLIQLTWVNLNGVLCPFQFDPFIGRYYRLWANIHQTLFMIIHHKLFSVVARTCIQFDLRRIMYYLKRQEKIRQHRSHSDILKDE